MRADGISALVFDPFGRGGSGVGWHQSGMEWQWAGSKHWAEVGYPTTVAGVNTIVKVENTRVSRDEVFWRK